MPDATEHLLLLLGRGSPAETVRRREYHRATYFLPDQSGRTVTTPFVGEALLRLYPDRFDRVYLLGTTASMWETLYHHTLPDALTAEEGRRLDVLLDAVADGTLMEDPTPLTWVEAAFTQSTGVTTSCHVVPVGRTDDEFWDTFAAMADLQIQTGTVSLDITHGLRAQPFFLLLILFYLRSVHADVEVGSAFYGALELSDSHFGEQTPIFDLRPMLQLMDWIEAALAFDRYGDAGPIARLLREAEADAGHLDRLARRAEYASQILQLNTLSDLRANMRNFVKALDRHPEGHLPLDLIRPRLKSFPETIAATATTWHALLRVARQHWNHYRAGLAVLAAWEAVVARMADVYGRSDHTVGRVHGALGHAACDWSQQLMDRVYRPAGMDRFPERNDKLRRFRNGIAHAEHRQENHAFEVAEVYRVFPEILDDLEAHLGSAALQQLPELRPLRFHS